MTRQAFEQIFNGTSISYSSGYDKNYLNLGQWIQQKTGSLPKDNYVGPAPVAIVRPLEANIITANYMLHAIDIGNNTHWVFAGISGSAISIYINLYVHHTDTQEFHYKGYIAPGFADVAALTGLRVVRHLHTTGTVAVTTGGAVTGTSTQFNGGGGATPAAGGVAVGARIGFGSTDPNSITTWYNISAISSDTAASLGSTVLPAAIAAGTSYVIEELRVYLTMFSDTTALGGLYVCKGVNFDDFSPQSVSWAKGSTVDNAKNMYFLQDTGNLNTTPMGLGLGTSSNSSTILYVTQFVDAANIQVYKYEGRAALAGTLTAGVSTAAYTLKTGNGALDGDAVLQIGQHLTVASPVSPSGSALFFCAGTRVYRCLESNITSSSTTFISDSMTEVPTGGTATFPVSSMAGIEYSSTANKFLITANDQLAGTKLYSTNYNSIGTALGRIFGADTRQLHSFGADPDVAHYPGTNWAANTIATVNGMAYFCAGDSDTVVNSIMSLPIGADWDYAVGLTSASQNRLIAPVIPMLGGTVARKLYRVSVLSNIMEGSATFGIQNEPFRIAYRQGSTIAGDTESWTYVAHDGDISAATGASDLQFMIEFRLLGNMPIPAKIYGIVVEYEDTYTDSHYEPSATLSNYSSKIFAWRFAEAFGTTVPTLRITIQDDPSNAISWQDNSVSPANGTFEKSIDGGANWTAYNTTDKANEITYIRYTCTGSTGAATKLHATLQQN